MAKPVITPTTRGTGKGGHDEQITAKEIIDPKVIDTLKERFRKKASDILVEKLTAIDAPTKDFLINHLIREMLGLGKIEFLPVKN